MKMKKKRIYGSERLPKTDEEWYAHWNLIPNFDTEKERLDYIKKEMKKGGYIMPRKKKEDENKYDSAHPNGTDDAVEENEKATIAMEIPDNAPVAMNILDVALDEPNFSKLNKFLKKAGLGQNARKTAIKLAREVL